MYAVLFLAYPNIFLVPLSCASTSGLPARVFHFPNAKIHCAICALQQSSCTWTLSLQLLGINPKSERKLFHWRLHRHSPASPPRHVYYRAVLHQTCLFEPYVVSIYLQGIYYFLKRNGVHSTVLLLSISQNAARWVTTTSSFCYSLLARTGSVANNSLSYTLPESAPQHAGRVVQKRLDLF